MTTELNTVFSNEDLEKLLDQTVFYNCFCPGQVAGLARDIRDLHKYQQDCLSGDDTFKETHERISEAAKLAHSIIEECLSDVLKIENWDKDTLKMPDGLRDQVASSAADQQ